MCSGRNLPARCRFLWISRSRCGAGMNASSRPTTISAFTTRIVQVAYAVPLQAVKSMHMKHLFHFLILASVLFALSGCDSGDPINQPTPADVAGTYRFEELRFVPDAAATQPADVLSR